MYFGENSIGELNLFENLDLLEGDEFSIQKIREDLIATFKRKFPQYEVHESDPLYELISSFAYREILLRQMMNTVAKSFCKELRDIHRETAEVCGTKLYYEEEAKKTKEVLAAAAVRQENGIVQVFVHLAAKKEEHGTLIAQIITHLNHEDIRMLTDQVLVFPVEEVSLTIEAEITRFPNSVVTREAVAKKFLEEFQKVNKLGQSISISWILANLHQPGVANVLLKSSPPPGINHNQILKLEEICIHVL
jgi:phage-related baseplate assembly protein